jgi:hypothetical protein
VALNSHIEREADTHGVDHALPELSMVHASKVNGCGSETELFSEKERAALALTEAMSRLAIAQNVPDDVYGAAARAFSEEQLAVVVWAASLIQAFNALNVAIHRPLAEVH